MDPRCFAQAVPASVLRRWLLPYVLAGVECYPRQDEACGYGSLIRLSLGVHRRSGRRYPFVTWTEHRAVPVASSMRDTLAWLATVERAAVPGEALPPPTHPTSPTHPHISITTVARTALAPRYTSIRDWCVLAGAPPFVQIWPYLVSVLTATEVPIYTWNAEFDREALRLTAKRFGLAVPESVNNKTRWRCAMKLHARWYGEWSNGRNDYRYQPLEWACTELRIEEGGYHRAIGDAQNALRVLRAIGARAGKYPPPNDMPSFQRYYGD